MDLKNDTYENIISLDTNDILSLRNKITKMNRNDQIEILRLLRKNRIKYTENKNGIFINLTKLPNRMLLELQNFVDFSIQNKDTIEKENIIRDSYRNQVEKDNVSNSIDSDNLNTQNQIVSVTSEEIIKREDYILFENETSYSLSESQKQLCGL